MIRSSLRYGLGDFIGLPTIRDYDTDFIRLGGFKPNPKPFRVSNGGVKPNPKPPPIRTRGPEPGPGDAGVCDKNT